MHFVYTQMETGYIRMNHHNATLRDLLSGEKNVPKNETDFISAVLEYFFFLMYSLVKLFLHSHPEKFLLPAVPMVTKSSEVFKVTEIMARRFHFTVDFQPLIPLLECSLATVCLEKQSLHFK